MSQIKKETYLKTTSFISVKVTPILCRTVPIKEGSCVAPPSENDTCTYKHKDPNHKICKQVFCGETQIIYRLALGNNGYFSSGSGAKSKQEVAFPLNSAESD